MAKAPKSGEIVAKLRPDVNDRPRQVRSFCARNVASHVKLQAVVGPVPAVVWPAAFDRETVCSHGRTHAKPLVGIFSGASVQKLALLPCAPRRVLLSGTKKIAFFSLWLYG